MSPQCSVVLDPELGQRARGEPVRIALTGDGKFDDPAGDKFGFVISRTDGNLKPRARGVKGLAHGFNVLGLESESVESGLGIVELTPCGAALTSADEL
jgi:hypothetical protein